VKTGILYSNQLRYYDFGSGHPFRGDRFERFMSFFNKELGKSGKFEVLLNEEAACDDDLELWHTKEYIQAMKRASAGFEVPDLLKYISGDNVNPLTRRFPEGIEPAARVAVKNSMLACELVQEGKYEKVVSIGGGFHHAKPSYGEGFCVYNDVVISAKYAIRKYDLERILILDTDAHAGNGTYEAFYSDPRVLFVDMHQKYIYPGTGYEDEVGEGKGKGYTVNVPLPPYASDMAYKFVFNELIFPLVEKFNPQLVIRNGGSDPHPSDEITQLGLTLKGFRYIGESVRKISKICGGKEIDLICSGYKPEVLSRAWSAIISGLAGVEIVFEEPFDLVSPNYQTLEIVKKVVKKVKTNLKPYWKNLNR
jgi:acetoin utilization protein AcuC